MIARRVVVCVAALCLGLAAPAAPPQSAPQAAEAFAQGNTLLTRGDFEGAYKAYSAAAGREPNNNDYVTKAALVRRVITLRQTLAELEGSPKWLPAVQALYAFYDENAVHSEALALAEKAYAREKSAQTAVLLARARLALGQNAAAATGLRELPPEQATLETRLLLGLALARQPRLAEARALLAEVNEPADAEAALLFDLARLRALAGEPAGALQALTKCFERTPPSQLDGVKARARSSADFAALQADGGFAAALATSSKVTESQCSAGPTCGQCPHRKTCETSDKKPEHDACKPGDEPKKPEKP